MTSMIELLSNVNVAPIAMNLRSRGLEVMEAPGYGDVFEPLIEIGNRVEEKRPDAVFILVDATALLAGCRNADDVSSEIGQWFSCLDSFMPGGVEVYVSDVVLRYDPYCADSKSAPSLTAEALWEERLLKACGLRPNLFRFPLTEILRKIGLDSSYSSKLWYIARAPYSASAQVAIADRVASMVENAEPEKKVLAIDLDNTIWGGVVGELGPQGIDLSDEHLGLAYKESQREISRMKDAGVVLAVVSKNNFEDGIAPFLENGHMQLAREDITSYRINWNRKDENLKSIAEELSLGLDSFVYLDDNPVERSLIAELLPEVSIVDFPDDPADLPEALRQVYGRYFKRGVITDEDRLKAEQYIAFGKRAELERESLTYDAFLEGLEIEIRRVDPNDHAARIAQLVRKTNQFNLTTRRYGQSEIDEMIASPDWEVYAFDVTDRFGDNGVTAVLLVNVETVPVVDTFVMSCRIMGKQIEDAVLGYAERDLAERGFRFIRGEFIPSDRNAPSSGLYQRLGYELVEQSGNLSVYEMGLEALLRRAPHVKEVLLNEGD